MKIINAVVALLSACAFLTSSAQTTTEVKDFAMEYANAYCSNAPEIIGAYDASSVAFMMDNETEKFNLGDFGTTVHEGLHSYDGDLSLKYTNELIRSGDTWDGWMKAYFINTNVVIKTERHKVFKTSTLHANYFPDSVKRLDRYGTYIQEWEGKVSDENSKLTLEQVRAYGVEEFKNGEARSTSNVQGFYGLLEEFNAYHHGVKAEYEVMSQAPNIMTFGRTNEINSYYEFNIFMAYYLKYAKEKRKDIYAVFIDDYELRTAYTLIELSWRELLTNVYSDEKSRGYFNLWSGEYDLYTDELRSVMNEFMLPTSELGEYTSYAASKKFDLTLIEEAIKKTGDFKVEEIAWNDQDDWGDDDNWGDDDWDWDGDWQMLEVAIETMDPDYFYVVTTSSTDMDGAFEAFEKVSTVYAEAEMCMDANMTYYVSIGKFKDKAKAIVLSKKAKTKFPNVKVQ